MGPARPSGRFNYEKQRKGGGEGGLDDGGSGGGGGVFVCVGVLECVYGGTREQIPLQSVLMFIQNPKL